MKEITAIIQPHTVSRVMRALYALPHFPGVTLLDAHGQGRGRGAGGGGPGFDFGGGTRHFGGAGPGDVRLY